MSRTTNTTILTAIAKDATRPAYLIRIGFATEKRAATWDSDISFNGETWTASGIEVGNLSRASVSLDFPLGDGDPWMALFHAENARGIVVNIYQHYTDLTSSPQTGAILMFTGIMDEAVMTDKIKVSVQEKSRVISFPPDSVGPPKFTHFLQSGTTITWAGDTLKVR